GLVPRAVSDARGSGAGRRRHDRFPGAIRREHQCGAKAECAADLRPGERRAAAAGGHAAAHAEGEPVPARKAAARPVSFRAVGGHVAVRGAGGGSDPEARDGISDHPGRAAGEPVLRGKSDELLTVSPYGPYRRMAVSPSYGPYGHTAIRPYGLV